MSSTYKKLAFLVSTSLLLQSQPTFSKPQNEQISPLIVNAYKTNHLTEITFNKLFHKSFYQKSYFTPAVMGTSIVAAGAFTFFTAGAGAPAAAAGVGSVATAIGGGTAGAYMAGLSTIGGLFGGNAILGAAILNGISIGTIGGVAGATGAAVKLSFAAKTATLASIGFTGVAFLPENENGSGKYIFDLRIPHKEIGSGTLRKLIQNVEETQENLNDALTDGNGTKTDILMEQRQSYYNQANKMLKLELQKPTIYTPNMTIEDLDKLIHKSYLFQSPEDLIVLSVIAYRSGEFNLFQKGIQAAKKNIILFKDEANIKDSYLSYLEGVAELSKEEPDIDYAKQKFTQSWQEEPYALEPAVALITTLGNGIKEDRVKLAEVAQITKQAIDQFDSDKYVPRVTEVGTYFNTATIYLRANDYSSALKYYQLANNSIGFIARHSPGEASTDMVNNIRIMEAICLFELKKGAKAAEIFNDIMADYKDSPEKAEQFKAIYQGV